MKCSSSGIVSSSGNSNNPISACNKATLRMTNKKTFWGSLKSSSIFYSVAITYLAGNMKRLLLCSVWSVLLHQSQYTANNIEAKLTGNQQNQVRLTNQLADQILYTIDLQHIHKTLKITSTYVLKSSDVQPLAAQSK